jgi:hypothetical protein
MPRITSQPVPVDMSTVRIAQLSDRPRNVLRVSEVQTPAMDTTVDDATMYPKVRKTETAAPMEGPNALPVKVTNDPVDGVKRENCAIVFVRNRMTNMAARMVKGAASPAPRTMTEKPKKKLMAGAMLARVVATIWLSESTLRRSRTSPVFGLDVVSLTGMALPGSKVVSHVMASLRIEISIAMLNTVSLIEAS